MSYVYLFVAGLLIAGTLVHLYVQENVVETMIKYYKADLPENEEPLDTSLQRIEAPAQPQEGRNVSLGKI